MSGEGLDETTRLGRRTGRSFAVLVSMLTGLVMGYGSTSCSPSSSQSSSAAGTSCRATGGTCVLGGATCTKQAASSAQDCNPPPVNPGGAFCCLELQEGGISNPSDGGEMTDAGCGADVVTYQCSIGPLDAGGCAPIGVDGSVTGYYPLGCSAQEPGCTAATVPPSPLGCMCMQQIPDSGPATWICPN
jgi:hypothetical protein